MVLGLAADDVTNDWIDPKALGVARETRPMELELQPPVEMEPQRPLLGFTHWIPSSEGVSGANSLILRKHSATCQRESRIHLGNPG
jgi:hypothetical protein